MRSEFKPLREACQELAARCDGARSEDGAGFSKIDTSFGKQMANLPVELWTFGQTDGVYEMLEKYKAQLSMYGIDYDELPAPSEEEKYEGRSEDDRSIGLETEGQARYVIDFEYDPEIVGWVKDHVTGRQFDGDSKTWRCPAVPETYEQLQTLSEEYDFNEPPEPPESKSLRRVELAGGGDLAIFFPYEEDLVAAVKRLPGATFEGDVEEKHWRVPIGADPELLEEITSSFDFDVDPAVEREIDRYLENQRKNLTQSAASEAEVEVPGLTEKLDPYPFQRAGIEYASRNKRTFIADEMGLGKTVQSIATVHRLDAYPALFVVPASLKHNWAKELAMWIPELRGQISIADGTDMEDQDPIVVRLPGGDQVEVAVNAYDARALIINYDLLSLDAEPMENKRSVRFGPLLEALEARQNQAIVLDESHYVKSHDALRTQAVRKLARGIDVRLLLTGTPLVNRPKELISQLQILGRLDDLGGFWPFAERYCDAHKEYGNWVLDGSSNLEELNQKLRERCYVRRRKEEVLSELPDKTRSDITVEITNREEYRRAEQAFAEWMRETLMEDPDLEERVKERRDDWDELSQFERTAVLKSEINRFKRAEQLTKIGALKQLVARGKLQAAIEWIHDFLASGEKLVVFAIHKEILQALQEEFPEAARIVAEDDNTERQANVERFQEDDDSRLMIAALGSSATSSPGGVGHTLTAASNVAFVELGWSPTQHDQAIDRCHRIGQESSVTAWYLIAAETIEEKIRDLIEEKREVVTEATDGQTTSSKRSMMDDLMEYMAEQGEVPQEPSTAAQ